MEFYSIDLPLLMKSQRAIASKRSQWWEPALWTGVLLALYLLNPQTNVQSFCIFKRIGFVNCLGCGLGHAIHHALQLHFRESIQSHWLGIPVVLILVFKILHPFLSLFNLRNGPTTTIRDVA